MTLFLTLSSGALLRLALSLYAPLVQTLQARPELSSPPTSLATLREAIYRRSLYDAAPALHAGVYAGDVLAPPLVVQALAPILALAGSHVEFSTAGNDVLGIAGLKQDDVVEALLWTALDLFTAWGIAACARKAAKRNSVSPNVAAALYLFSPYTLATSLSRSTAPLNNLFIVIATYAALCGSRLLLLPALAAATLVSLYPVLLTPALVLLCAQSALRGRKRASVSRHVFLSILGLAITLAGGIGASWLVAGEDWAFLDRVYGTIFLARDNTPNIGLWWYFFIEIFEHFRNFFLLAFNVHVASYALPLTIKYSSDPLFAVTALTGVISVFKSYPTMGDTALFLGLLGLHTELFAYLRYPLVSALLFAYASVLLPIFHHLWLRAGSGNANFYYAITLVWGLAAGALTLDVMWAWGRARWEETRMKVPLPLEEVVAERRLAGPPRIGSDGAAPPSEKILRPKKVVREVVQE